MPGGSEAGQLISNQRHFVGQDPERSQRVIHAVMGMKKLEMEAMQRAYD
jgi:hypothetical protein